MSDKKLSQWVIKHEDGSETPFYRRKLTEKEVAQRVLGLSDMELDHYVPNSLKEEHTDEGIKYTGILRFSGGDTKSVIGSSEDEKA